MSDWMPSQEYDKGAHPCQAGAYPPYVIKADLEIKKLRAEVERLRGIIKTVVDGYENDDYWHWCESRLGLSPDPFPHLDVLRAALAEQPGEAKDQSLGPVGGRCLNCGKQGGLRRGIEFPVSTPQITAVVCRFCGFEHPDRQPPPDGGGEKGK